MHIVGQFVVVVAVWMAGGLTVTSVPGPGVVQLIAGVLAAVLAVAAYRWVVRRTERRAPAEVALKGAGRSLARGTGVGVLMFVAVIAVIAAFGGYRIESWGSVTAAAGLLGLAAAASATEEVLFRGLIQRHLESWAGTWVALAVTGALFGAMHLLNPAATAWGAFAIAVEAGLMLGAAFVATRSLWLPIGIHMGWNFAASGIFGTVVSGNLDARGLLEGVTSGPVLLAGGAFGPEASLVAVLSGAALTVVLMVVAYRRGHVVPMRRAARRRTEDAAPVATLSA
ncbi:MAG: CPBP family intramembrane metalloprotease [Cellulomonas sp.]|uniref:CPBP family intramembrane glutamic endopeptidase n=1 Tax=Cellulomonas sp. TaxID=40001 RepID=UPI0019F29ECB|nr:CPBP family intramembrane glutamic endopeptidase [Cellulomonas sp.]MBF0687745.1 CPBP family intramembrane metalloprotease [Cellulomonas sp.]